jgi:hypothetical protein
VISTSPSFPNGNDIGTPIPSAQITANLVCVSPKFKSAMANHEMSMRGMEKWDWYTLFVKLLYTVAEREERPMVMPVMIV